MAWKTLDDIDLAGKVVLTRVDINVPVEAGRVTDATRIERIVPTVEDILARGGKPVLLAHFDRPKGKVVPEMSRRLVLPALNAALGRDVAFAEDCVGETAAAAVAALPDGDVLLLENTRFHKGEETNDPDFAAALAALGDVYCNDAFSAAHRAHASTEGIARLLPSCAGRLMQAELQALEKALAAPDRPVVAVIGGAKVSTKLELLGNLVAKVDASSSAAAWPTPSLRRRASTSASRWPSTTCSTPRARSSRTRRPPAAKLVCRRTWWWRASSRPGPRARSSPRPPARGDAMILDVGPRRSRTSPTCSAARGRWSGTARSAPSRSRRSTPRPTPPRARPRR